MTNFDDSFLRIAKCGRTIGLKGELALWPISNVEARYIKGSLLFDDDKNIFEIEKIRTNKDHYVVKFIGIDNLEHAKTIVNLELLAPPLNDDILESGEFFVHDLLDKIIIDTDGVEHGLVKTVIPNAASDLLENEKRQLVPFCFIEKFDDRYVYVNAPEGLFDLGEK
jgi:16S rRNA processing protein RimM